MRATSRMKFGFRIIFLGFCEAESLRTNSALGTRVFFTDTSGQEIGKEKSA